MENLLSCSHCTPTTQYCLVSSAGIFYSHWAAVLIRSSSSHYVHSSHATGSKLFSSRTLQCNTLTTRKRQWIQEKEDFNPADIILELENINSVNFVSTTHGQHVSNSCPDFHFLGYLTPGTADPDVCCKFPMTLKMHML